MIMTVARATGWSEDKILWKIPMSRVCQYIHAEWTYGGVTCYWSCYNRAEDDVINVLDKARAEWQETLGLLE